MTPYVMREAFRTNAPDKLLEFYRTVQDILHNKSMTEIEQLNRIRIMAGAAACGEGECADMLALAGDAPCVTRGTGSSPRPRKSAAAANKSSSAEPKLLYLCAAAKECMPAQVTQLDKLLAITCHEELGLDTPLYRQMQVESLPDSDIKKLR